MTKGFHRCTTAIRSGYLTRINKRVSMMLDGEHKRAQRDTERRVNAEALGAAIEAQAAPPERCKMMLKVLGRDDALRASYLRRRWQGLSR
jgi:hypothetical protein